ncbi:MAG: hypothetical protein LN566_07325, partial [Rickettsia endosymbiont of Stiretrus anchorago]|nr:hypothetical protein [Rickettsia endosymbiont of Stiretrus anchorago]
MAKLQELIGDRKTKTKSPLEICSFLLSFRENRKKKKQNKNVTGSDYHLSKFVRLGSEICKHIMLSFTFFYLF